MKIHPIEWMLMAAVVAVVVAVALGVRKSGQHAEACQAAGGAWMHREMVCLPPSHHQPYRVPE